MSALFDKPVIHLDGCALSGPPTAAQAQAVGDMLAASEPWRTLQFPATALANCLTRDDPALHRYIISVEGEVAGTVCIRHPWLRGPYIELLGIAPAQRGKGIGRQVMAWAESEARGAGANLWVVASAFNHRALAFYQGLGFETIGPIKGLVRPEYDEILLRKALI